MAQIGKHENWAEKITSWTLKIKSINQTLIDWPDKNYKTSKDIEQQT